MESNPDKTLVKGADRPLFGAGIALLSFFMFALMGALSKILSDDVNPIAIAGYRNIIGLSFLVPWLLLTGQKALFRTNNLKIQIPRGLWAILGLSLTLYTYKYLDVAQSTVLFFSSSLIMPVLGLVILKEAIGKKRGVAIIIGFVGVLIASNPGSDVNIIGVVLGLCGALAHAGAGIFLRFLGRIDDEKTTIFYVFLISTIAIIPIYPFIDWTIPMEKWWLMGVIGLIGSAGQFFLTKAYIYVQPVIVAPLVYLGLVWATLFDIFLFATIPAKHVFIGAGIIIICNIYILYRERKRTPAI